MTSLTAKVLKNYADRLEPHGVLPFTGVRVLFGSAAGDAVRDTYRRLGFGRMWAESNTVDPYPGEPWGFDNGAYGAWRRGENFPEDRFRDRLDQAAEIADRRDAPPLFAVVPDLVKQGLESLEFSLSWVVECRSRVPDGNWYLGVQDGFTRERLDPVIDQFDGLLLGGGDQMKDHARTWACYAHDRDLEFHYARCGTPKKLRHAFAVGADSLDSVFPLRDPNRLGQTITQIAVLHRLHFGDGGSS